MNVGEWIGVLVAWHLLIGFGIAWIFEDNRLKDDEYLRTRGKLLLWLLIPFWLMIYLLYLLGKWFFILDDVYE